MHLNNCVLVIAIFSAMLLKQFDEVSASDKRLENKNESLSENSPFETSFQEWRKWRKLYKSCNPKKNPFTSPIAISSSSVIKVEDMQTLLVHGNRPEANIYAFSTVYNKENVQMESFNIKPRGDEVLRHATFISGLGSTKYRVFRDALIMFRSGKDTEPLNDRQSFHSVDEKEYPMEIMFNFETHNTALDQTQIHVLVELAEEENPAWKPILNMFGKLIHNIIHEACFGAERSKAAFDNLQVASTLYKEALMIENNETRGLTYKLAVKELTALTEMLKDAGDEAMERLTNLQLDASVQRDKCQQELIVVNEQLRKLQKEMNTRQNDKDFSETNSEKLALLNKSLILSSCIEEQYQKLNDFQNEWSRQNELKRKSRVGNESTDLFRSVKDVSILLDEMKEKLETLEFVKDVFENALHDIENLNTAPTRSVLIQDSFQISWLFPSTGGFYFYNGSSPVPPCERRSHVIVFEHPITITEEQLSLFQNFPSFSQNPEQIAKICELKSKGMDDNSAANVEILMAMEKIRLQVPPLKPLGERTVWYNPKNIQFRDDDGMHMQSSIRRQLEEQQTNSTNRLKDCTGVVFLVFYMTLYG